MNAEAQKLMDTINRLMAKGMSRDDDTIKTLEGLIEEELAKGKSDPSGRSMDFMNTPDRPQVERPGNRSQGDYEEGRWRDREKRMEDYGYRGQPDSPDLPSQKDMDLLGESGDLGTELFADRFGLERMTPRVPPPIPGMDWNYIPPNPHVPEGAPMPRPRPLNEGRGITPEEFERMNPNWREEERRLDYEQRDLGDVERMMRDWKQGPEADKYALSDNMGGIFDRGIPPGMSKNMGPFPNQPISPFEPRAHYGFSDIPALLNEVPNPATENMSDRRSFQRPSAGPSTEEELEMIMKGAEDEPIYEDEYQ